MARISRSEEMLKTALVIKWLIMAEHCADLCQLFEFAKVG